MQARSGVSKSGTRALRTLAVAVGAIGLWLLVSSMPATADTVTPAATKQSSTSKKMSSHYTSRTPHKSGSTSSANSVTPAVTPPPPMFTQCPAVGLNTGCRLLIVINADGSVVVLVDSNQSTTYDGSEDTLIGVQNNSNAFVQSLDLTSALDAFGFDEDGICDLGTDPTFPSAPGCSQSTVTDSAGNPAFGPTGYEGPFTSFTNVSTDGTSGTVNFTNPPSSGGAGCGFATPQPGLAPGASAYFGLEEEVSGSDLSLANQPVVTPCPPPTTAPPPPPQAVQGNALARTGSNTGAMVQLAVMLLLTGALMIACSRRLALRAAASAA
jgi:hypothetical protein